MFDERRALFFVASGHRLSVNKFAAAVSVSTDTKGLAGYVLTVEVRNSAGALVAVTLPAASFTPSFKIDGNSLVPAQMVLVQSAAIK